MRKTKKQVAKITERIRSLNDAGLSNAEIAKATGLTVKTVENYKNKAGIVQISEPQSKMYPDLFDAWSRLHDWYLRYRYGEKETKAEVLIPWDEYSLGAAWLK